MTGELRSLRRRYPHGLTPPKLATALGVSARMIEKRVAERTLPVKEHGPKKRLIEWPTIQLIHTHGLVGVGRQMMAGEM